MICENIGIATDNQLIIAVSIRNALKFITIQYPKLPEIPELLRFVLN
jgi:hypothetical protein